MIEYEPLEIFGCNCCGDLEQTARFTLKPDVVPRMDVTLCATCLDKALALLQAESSVSNLDRTHIERKIEILESVVAGMTSDRLVSELAKCRTQLAALNSPAEGKENN